MVEDPAAAQAGADAGAAGPFQLRIEPLGWVQAVPAHLPLLKSLQRAGIRLPSSCRNGSCRACLCPTQSGRVAYRIDWPGLSAEEKQQGDILPCVAYPLSDLVIVAPRAERIDTTPAAPARVGPLPAWRRV